MITIGHISEIEIILRRNVDPKASYKGKNTFIVNRKIYTLDEILTDVFKEHFKDYKINKFE